MAATVQKILEDLRALSPVERLRVVEQVVHEVAVDVRAQHAPAHTAIWADESASDFQAFQSALARLRSTDTCRIGDEQKPA